MIDAGSGPPVIVIPGVQGRWEWMAPALHALQQHCRVVSYSLCGDAGSGMSMDPALGFDNYVHQLDAVYEKTGLSRATLCGVSYGGFIALRYAATYPERVGSLILVSAPAPGWVPNQRQQRYLAKPRLYAPIFALTAPARLWPEVRSSIASWPERLRFVVTYGARVVSAPLVPSNAAARMSVQQATDFSADAARVRARTLVITGEDALDLVVPPAVTRWYVSQIPGARHVTLERTGHIGLVTQPGRFAHIVSDFVHANHH